MLHQTEDTLIRSALLKLEDCSEEIRRVVTDLVKSGFNDLDELVELAGIARESILSAQQEGQPSRSARLSPPETGMMQSNQ